MDKLLSPPDMTARCATGILPPGQEEKVIPVKQRGLFPISLSPDGQLLAVGCEFMVKVFNVNDGAQVDEQPVDAKGVYAVAFSPDGRYLASGSADKRVRVWATA